MLMNRTVNRADRLNDAVFLTMCYTQHTLHSIIECIDTELKHIK